MTDFSTDGAHTRAVHKLTGVTMIPMLVHELSVGRSECTQFVG